MRACKTLAWNGLLFVTNSKELYFRFLFHLKQIPEWFKPLQCLYHAASSLHKRSWHCWLQALQVILSHPISQQNTAQSVIIPQTLSSSKHICPASFSEIICLDKLHTLQRNPFRCFLVLLKVRAFHQESLPLLGHEEGILVGRSRGSQTECKATAEGIALIASKHWTLGYWRTRWSPGSPRPSRLSWGHLKRDWGVDSGSSRSPHEFLHLQFFL